MREMLVIDDQGKVKPTRLIESVQFRVYREVPKGDPAHPEGFDDVVGKQDFYEFRITRKDLFAGPAGGLHAVGPRDEEILPLLNPPADDPFEEAPPVRPGTFRTLCSAPDATVSRGFTRSKPIVAASSTIPSRLTYASATAGIRSERPCSGSGRTIAGVCCRD